MSFFGTSDAAQPVSRPLIFLAVASVAGLIGSSVYALVTNDEPEPDATVEPAADVFTNQMAAVEMSVEQREAHDVLAKRATGDLLPDLVPLPPQDVALENRDGVLALVFSTTYYNQGDGNLELVPDAATRGIRADIERDVSQRIYRDDNTHRDKLVGTFLWHQEHLHYHYSDFVTYDLEAVDAPGHPDLEGVRMKATFCLRDVSIVDIDLPTSKDDANYRICGKELQGVTVGWGDTYFYYYPDQALNVSDLPSGTYRLSFHVNPDDRLDELRYGNNVASAVIKLDTENETVEVVETTPASYPSIEHIYVDQEFEEKFNPNTTTP